MRISIAVFVVNNKARITYANPAAEALLKRSASLQSKDGALQCGDAAASRKLQTAIARACRRDQPAEFGEAFIPSEGEEAMEIAVAPATSQSPFAPLLSAAPCCVVFANDRSQRRWDGLRRFARHYPVDAVRGALARRHRRRRRSRAGGGSDERQTVHRSHPLEARLRQDRHEPARRADQPGAD